MDYLPEELVLIIQSYLSEQDIYNSGFIDPFYLHTKRIICKRILEKLKDIFRTDYNIFIIFLKESGALISGSFILQIICGAKWMMSDIDIYIKEKNRAILEKLIKDLGMTESKKLNKTWLNYDETIRTDKKLKILDMLYDNRDIQFIITEDPKKFIDEDFDIDICLNYFYYNKEEYFDIYIYNYLAILTKRMNILNETKYDRINKYVCRGFKLNFNVNYLKYLEYKINLLHSIGNLRISTKIIDDKGFFIYLSPNEVNLAEYYKLNTCAFQDCIIDKFFDKVNHIHIIKNGQIDYIAYSSIIIC